MAGAPPSKLRDVALLLLSGTGHCVGAMQANGRDTGKDFPETGVPCPTNCLGASAESIEEEKEENSDDGVDERGDGQRHIEPELRLREEYAARERDQALMHYEERSGEREPRRGMLRIEPCADGRSEIPDYGFRDTVEPQRNRRAAETVLQKTDDHAQKKSGGRIAPAEAEINGHQQWQIKDGGLCKMNRKRCLDDKRQQSGDDDRARAKLVNFDVRFAADIKRVVHRLTAGGGLAAPDAGGCPSAEFSSFFISKGRSDRRTSTSSRRSRLAAGLMRISLNVLPGLISATVPTGRSRGKMRSMPLVMTRSPRLTVSSFGTYFMTSRGSPFPPTGLWMRESANIAPTPLSLSVSRSTCDAFG